MTGSVEALRRLRRIATADGALCEAKEGGRDRVALAVSMVSRG